MERTLSITTPEQATLEWQIAGIGSRAIATLIDTGFLLLGYALLGWGLFAASKSGAGNPLAFSGMTMPRNYEIAFYILLLFFLPLLYYVLFEGLWGGRTPGKRLIKLRVVSHSGQSISFFSALMRNIVRIVDFLPSGYLIGMICIFLTGKEQRLGDLAAGTVVIIDRNAISLTGSSAVLKQKLRRGKSRHRTALADAAAPVAVPQQVTQLASVCSDRTRELVTAFLAREPRLSVDRRLFLAERLLQHALREGQTKAHGQQLQTLADWSSTQTALEVLKDLASVWEQPGD